MTRKRTWREPDPLPRDDRDTPYYVIGDEAFALRTWLMKPFTWAMKRESSIIDCHEPGELWKMHLVYWPTASAVCHHAEAQPQHGRVHRLCLPAQHHEGPLPTRPGIRAWLTRRTTTTKSPRVPGDRGRTWTTCSK